MAKLPAAIAVVLNKPKQTIVLVKRRDVAVWVLPGGGIDPGEVPIEAVIRETKEETGLDVQVKRLAAVLTPINKMAQQTYLFECEKIGGSFAISSESAQVAEFPLNALPSDFFIVHKQWLDDILSHPNETLHQEIRNVTYWKFFVYILKHPWIVLRYAYTFFTKT